MNMSCDLRRQRGLVLIISLLILLMTSILAATVYETNTLQMRMAGNEQTREGALQRTLATVDAIVARQENFPLHGSIGYRACDVEAMDESCDETSIVVDRGRAPWARPADYSIVRKGPLEVGLPSMAEGSASSGWHYRAALYEVRVAGAGDKRDPGEKTMAQGVLIRRLAGH